MRRRYAVLHRLGLTPWVAGEIPAQLRAIVEGPEQRPRGHAVDLGCGTGEHARYLAGIGWSVTAVDYVQAAVTAARRKDRGALVDWRVADATRPGAVDQDGTLAGAADLLLDVGCLHGLSAAQRVGWAETVRHLCAARATLLIRAAPAGRRGMGPAGIAAAQIDALLDERWKLIQSGSGWYHYERSARAVKVNGE